MRQYSVFDILGPVMIGPSSSHTAGAARLGKIAGILADRDIKKVEFLLHGSFAKTYRGHGTDRALVAGILGMDPGDERLRNSLLIANEKGIDISFSEIDLGDVHPNTVKILITKHDDTRIEMVGSSVGGGSIVINELDEEPVEITGDYPALIIKHKDTPGMVSKVSELIYEGKINIAFMKLFRNSKGSDATMIFETDTEVPESTVEAISKIGNVISIRKIKSVCSK